MIVTPSRNPRLKGRFRHVTGLRVWAGLSDQRALSSEWFLFLKNPVLNNMAPKTKTDKTAAGTL